MSEVRQRKVKERPETKEDPIARGSKGSRKEKSGGSPILTLFFLGLIALGGAFFYLNHTHKETYTQTGERVKQMVQDQIETFAKTDLGKTVQETVNKVIGGDKTQKKLNAVHQEYAKDFDVVFEDDSITITVDRCAVDPPKFDEHLKFATEAIGKELGSTIRSFKLNNYVCSQMENKGLISLIENLATYYPALKVLYLDFYGVKGVTDSGIQRFTEVLGSGFPGLEELTLNLTLFNSQVSTPLNDRSLDHFSAAIRNNLKNLRKLNMNFAMASGSTDDGITRFVTAVSESLPNLVDFSLETKWIDKYTNVFLQNLEKLLTSGGLKNLQRFYIGLDGQSKITNDGLTALFRGIGHLKGLTHIGISMVNLDKLNQSGVKELANSLSDKKLEDIYLHFFGISAFNDDCLIALSGALRSAIPTVRRLWLSNYNSKLVTNKGFAELAAVFDRKLPQLKDLSFDYTSSDKVNDAGVKPLLENIANNAVNLERLSLKFEMMPSITDETYLLLGKLFETKLHGLKQLLFNTRSKEIGDVGLIPFVNSIGKHLTKLEEFDILLSSASRVTDDGIVALGDVLKTQVKNLKKLGVSIYFMQFGDKGLKGLFDGIATHKDLTDLTLILNTAKVTSEGLKYAINKIGELKNLTYLQFSPYSLEATNDEVLQLLRNTVVKNLTKLTHVFINLSMTTGPSDASVEKLGTVFGTELPKLRRLGLHASQRPRRSEAIRPNILKAAPHIPSTDMVF